MIKKITREEMCRFMEDKTPFRLVDVLSRDHYEKEHIKGAISLPVDEIENRAQEILTDKDELIVVYCANFNCQASTRAAEKLQALGYKHVLDYKGGIEDYKQTCCELEGSLHESRQSVGSECCCCCS